MSIFIKCGISKNIGFDVLGDPMSKNPMILALTSIKKACVFYFGLAKCLVSVCESSSDLLN